MSRSGLRSDYQIVVIGGGFYGCVLAWALASGRSRVVILEREPELMSRASYANQARVHNGYHYPRSYLTALRSAANFTRFVEEFRECVDDTFEHVYGVARGGSKVSAFQFRKFCENIGAPLSAPSPHIRRLFNSALVEDTFAVTEYAFNAAAIREKLELRLEEAGVEVVCGTAAERIAQADDGRVVVHISTGETVVAERVLNCTYAGINELLEKSGLERLPLKFELAELALIRPPEALRNIGITIVDGPYFSTMPFPSRGLYTLSHVRYTPHYSWSTEEHGGLPARAASTNYPFMLKDAIRYVPALERASYVDSLFEVKVKLAQNKVDDGRPILFRTDYGFQNHAIVLGAKIDNIYDALAATKETGQLGGIRHGAQV